MTEREFNQTEKQFLDELQALLKKYDAEISLDQVSTQSFYPEYTVNISACSQWDDDGNEVSQDINISSSYFDGSK